MPLSRRTRWTLGLVVAAIVSTGAFLAHDFFSAYRRYMREERFCGAFHPVIDALREFQEQNGVPPTTLAQLLPGHLTRLPSAPIADTIEYRLLPDGTDWEISVWSGVRGTPELFVQRSSRVFTAEERQRSVTNFHGWLGFSLP
jgi:hypothetical protein